MFNCFLDLVSTEILLDKGIRDFLQYLCKAEGSDFISKSQH